VREGLNDEGKSAAIQMHAEHIAGGYVYPPLLAWSLVPLWAALPARLPYLVWVLAEMAGFAACLALVLCVGADPVRWHWVILAVGAAFLPFITWDNFYHGQVDFVLMMLVTVGLYLISKGRPAAGGILVAFAPSVKPFLAVLLIYLAWRSRWRAFFVAGLTGAGLLVLSFLPTLSQGTAVVEGWIEASRTQGMPPLIGHPFNHAIYGTLVRLFTPTPYAVAWAENPHLSLRAALAGARGRRGPPKPGLTAPSRAR
jgi:Glycosyltransferase family 87